MKNPITTAGTLPAKSVTASIKEIKILHGGIIHAAKTSLDSAIRIGELLDKIRSKIPHGQWQSWAEKNLPFDVRTARNYIRCFEERDRLKTETVSDLTTAYRLLTGPKTEPVEPSVQFAETEKHIKRVGEAIGKDAAELAEHEMPDGLITQSTFDGFLRDRGITLTNDDLIAQTVIRAGFNTGMVYMPEEIFEILQRFNPARKEAA